MDDNTISNHTKKKSKKNKKLKTKALISDEVKNKIKGMPVTHDEVGRLDAKDAETEDLAESVDSGCIPDSSSDIMADVMDTTQVNDNIVQYMDIFFCVPRKLKTLMHLLLFFVH